MDYSKMNREALRDACKAAGIKGYGKLGSAELRQALDAAAVLKEVKSQPTQAAQVAPAPVAVVAPVAAAPVVSAATGKPVTTRTGIKVEANREERNGLVRPSAGGICRAMWDAVEQSIDAGKMLTAKEFKVLSEANGWNWNNASAEYYKARQFRGITGRVK